MVRDKTYFAFAWAQCLAHCVQRRSSSLFLFFISAAKSDIYRVICVYVCLLLIIRWWKSPARRSPNNCERLSLGRTEGWSYRGSSHRSNSRWQAFKGMIQLVAQTACLTTAERVATIENRKRNNFPNCDTEVDLGQDVQFIHKQYDCAMFMQLIPFYSFECAQCFFVSSFCEILSWVYRCMSSLKSVVCLVHV